MPQQKPHDHDAIAQQGAQFVTATLPAFKAAADSADWGGAKNYAVSLIDLNGAQTWPIVSATFIELPKNPTDAGHSLNVMKFFDWAYSSGDSLATSLDYVTLPDAVKNAVRGAWKSQIMGPDGAPSGSDRSAGASFEPRGMIA